MTEPRVYRVRESYSFDENGVPQVYKTGDLVVEGTSAHRHGGANLEPVEQVAARAVERATAAPGEARVLSRPRRGAK